MRVTFIHPGTTRLPGGGTRVVYEHANQLAARGHQVNIVCPYAIDPLPKSPRRRFDRLCEWYLARWSASTRARLGESALRWLWIDPRIRFFFVPGLEERFVPDADAVFGTWWRTAEYVSSYSPNKGAKFYLIQHYETWGGPKDRVDATWKDASSKVVISHWLHDLGKSMGASGLRYIPYGIDHKHFKITNPPGERRMSLLAMFGTSEFKRTADALLVLERFHERYPDIPVTMFGLPSRSKGLPPWIRYFRNPSQDLLRDLYNSHAVYVCTSRAEGWHLPPAEAMACGCAFVSTDIGGVRDYAIDGKTALLSEFGDLDGLLRNLCRIAEDRELRTRLQAAGTDRIRQFTWEKSGNLLERYLYDVVETSRECHSPLELANSVEAPLTSSPITTL